MAKIIAHAGQSEGKGNANPLLVGVQTGATTVEVSVAVLQEAGSPSTSKATLGLYTLLQMQRYLLTQPHCFPIHKRQTLHTAEMAVG